MTTLSFQCTVDELIIRRGRALIIRANRDASIPDEGALSIRGPSIRRLPGWEVFVLRNWMALTLLVVGAAACAGLHGFAYVVDNGGLQVTAELVAKPWLWIAERVEEL